LKNAKSVSIAKPKSENKNQKRFSEIIVMGIFKRKFWRNKVDCWGFEGQ